MKIKTIALLGLVLASVCRQQTIFAADKTNETGFVAIFNGKDLTGWSGSPDLWSVADGAIVGKTTVEHPARENTFLIWTNGTVADFELRCSFKLTPGDDANFANSGIQYRSTVVKPEYWVVAGYQADMEAGPIYTGILYEEKRRGILATRGLKVIYYSKDKKEVSSIGDPNKLEASLNKSGWNDYVIIAKGNHLQQFINGHATVDFTDEDTEAAAKSGIVALQLHAGHPMEVQFKNIRVKNFK